MAMTSNCVKGFQWEGQPQGRFDKIAAKYDTYIAGDNPRAAVLIVHDLLGWTTTNVRLMADHYAREAGVTVYVPDFFAGDVFDFSMEMMPFVAKHSRDIHDTDVFAVARALRSEKKHDKVAAIGFCYGGWAALRLGAAAEHHPADPAAAPDAETRPGRPLVDAVSVAHPSLVTKQDLDQLAVPLQVLAPEHDQAYTAELKQHTIETVPRLGLPLDYLHFPGVEHGALMRGDPSKPGERDALVRAKMAAVTFFQFHLS
ncbi:dienelactone hydrolase family protein [Niveomyces insectorum RCEF 264]|uniref:Dienelactone hydrolase family protein n=1 Tax=Niveomyces insectorum RCEF 264 TaxID=1081102 RepID=A0A167P6N0_9HYPO|nr:dienelactone hydrolase family protein [Niveomyces insectorum RCEF 264]